ncbi:unnamed protein product [Aphanomyces euteiches]|uniref:Uncharacterized protein n=1 Tax=Aphanomyces euteiches TaxID=100861 RepID=A0A6G0WBV0_9STRA|nr:hypothetical protein Ae201684_016658 [Aphanomyces euteiches]KAH9078860.1 hypothetical protein Ae201684P_019927 [Aphanomyces euteiches]KAH9153635.1 hypothetical protein AeRB84_004146 [Aphanomyces euteiches]
MVPNGPVLADPEVGDPNESCPHENVNQMAFRALPLVVVKDRALPVVKVANMVCPNLRMMIVVKAENSLAIEWRARKTNHGHRVPQDSFSTYIQDNEILFAMTADSPQFVP